MGWREAGCLLRLLLVLVSWLWLSLSRCPHKHQVVFLDVSEPWWINLSLVIPLTAAGLGELMASGIATLRTPSFSRFPNSSHISANSDLLHISTTELSDAENLGEELPVETKSVANKWKEPTQVIPFGLQRLAPLSGEENQKTLEVTLH